MGIFTKQRSGDNFDEVTRRPNVESVT